MKRKLIFFPSILLLILIAVFSSANANTTESNKNKQWLEVSRLSKNAIEKAEDISESSVKLPKSLTTIEDNAFEGTSIISVELPENLVTIGDYAFAGIKTLRKISIPNSVRSIGINTFSGSNNLTITGAPKGYARAYAQENGIPFNPITSFYAFNNTVQITGISKGRCEEEKIFTKGEPTERQEHKPKGRLLAELNADGYETITAFHIQSRAPPKA